MQDTRGLDGGVVARSKASRGTPAPTRFSKKKRVGPPEPRPTRTSRLYRAVSSRIEVVITTYNRPDRLMLLLQDIELQGGGLDICVRVYDDASTADYSKVADFLLSRKQQFIRSPTRHGKKGLWRWMTRIFQDTRSVQANHFLFLQDDIRLCRDFFQRVLRVWRSLPDKRGTLNLHRDESRASHTKGCWTSAPLVREGEVSLTGWTDCAAFVCSREAIADLGWRLHPIPDDRWHENSGLSTGIGQQISTRLHSRGWALYRTEQSLVVHSDAVSWLNPDRKDSMRTVFFVDGEAAADHLRSATRPDEVTVSLATIPSRRSSLEQVVAQLLPQVDRLRVYLNETPGIGETEYPDIPRFLKHPKIVAVWSHDTVFGDQGDAGKYFWASEVRGYHIICDDDVLYPSDFVAALVKAIERYGRRAVVGFHGAVLTEPFQRYYGSRRSYHFTDPLKEDLPVHIVAGAGGVGYHTSTIKVHRDDFKHPNMGDIWFGLLAQQQQVPLICLAHLGGWLTSVASTGEDSIYSCSAGEGQGDWKNTADMQTRVIKENMPWSVRGAQGQIIQVVGEAR